MSSNKVLSLFRVSFITTVQLYKIPSCLLLYEKREWQTLYPILEDYVSKFGTVNFYKDTKLLWRLGKIEETFGNFEKAILLYKLVLRHHRADINIREIELHYDSLTANQQD